MDYWHAVEMFSPQQIPAVAPRKRVYEARSDRPLPWEEGHPLRRVRLDPGYVWQHVVYGGVYEFAKVRDVLVGVFGKDDEDHDGRMDGQSALYALTVNQDGRLLLDSPVFGTCPWATGRVLRPGPARAGWLDGFEGEAEAWRKRSAELGEELDPDDPEPVLQRLFVQEAADETPSRKPTRTGRAAQGGRGRTRTSIRCSGAGVSVARTWNGSRPNWPARGVSRLCWLRGRSGSAA
ncbi:hypothetical protein GXW82_32910 [Streptacidiphilus sp. 4-A2]|nr:hypothetical protein [Streptacidiphilus sp. 4-A2]